MSCSPLEHVRQVPRIPVAIDGIEISYDAIAREVQFHPASSPVKAWQAAARALAVRALLLREAQKLDLKPLPEEDCNGLLETDEEALIRQLMEQNVVTPEPDESACRRYYEQNGSRFRSPVIFEASHI
ncbi:MAG: peptidylprolyl isomerase, partial [Methyloligellaceae bacterium]